MSIGKSTKGNAAPGAESQARLCELVDRSRPALRGWFRHRDWPHDLPIKPPWSTRQVKRIREWAAEHLERRKESEWSPEERRLYALLLQERIQTMREKRHQLERRFHSVSDCTARLRACSVGFRRVLEPLPVRIAAELGLGADVQGKITSIVRRACGAFDQALTPTELAPHARP
jgi:hypothetical protein